MDFIRSLNSSRRVEVLLRLQRPLGSIGPHVPTHMRKHEMDCGVTMRPADRQTELAAANSESMTGEVHAETKPSRPSARHALYCSAGNALSSHWPSALKQPEAWAIIQSMNKRLVGLSAAQLAAAISSLCGFMKTVTRSGQGRAAPF